MNRTTPNTRPSAEFERKEHLPVQALTLILTLLSSISSHTKTSSASNLKEKIHKTPPAEKKPFLRTPPHNKKPTQRH